MALLAFDWNGTLADDTAAWAKAYNAALAVAGLPEQPLEVLQDRYDTPVKLSILNFGIDEDHYARIAPDLFRAFSQTLAVENAAPSLRPHAHETLLTLRNHGHTIILLSNHHIADLERELSMTGLTSAFDDISGRTNHAQIRDVTTKEERLALQLAARGFTPAQTIIIGDAREEARIARAGGYTCIGIAGGYSSRARLAADGAHRIVDCLREIPSVISSL